MSSDERASIIMSATFSADPVLRALNFWSHYLGEPLVAEMAPYAQLYQQLLDPASMLRRPENGAAVLFVRWSDLAKDAGTREQEAENLAEVILSADLQAPVLVLLCPGDGAPEESEGADDVLAERLSHDNRYTIINARDAFAQYDVKTAHDPEADKIGHVPYTEEAFAVLATAIARWRLVFLRRPVKLIAVDCDNTLWGGVVGEDGVAHLKIEDGHLALQQQLSVQAKGGQIVGLLSKNEERDVEDVFAKRPEMALRDGDILARRINWAAKADNIVEMAARFNIGLDSALFLDDSAIECAEMRARRPEVLTIRTPVEPGRLQQFVEHLWLFDRPPATAEDQRRGQMYRDDAVRNEARHGAVSLASFIAGLNLEIDISAADEKTIPRLAQLTQRTNQFNINLNRLEERDLHASLLAPDAHLYAVSLRDRFGDYGVVGQMRAREDGGGLAVDLFMLSCRALGRGVEHKMLAVLGALAVARNLKRVTLQFRPGPRNMPAARFLEDVFQPGSPLDVDRELSAPAGHIAAVKFSAAPSKALQTDNSADAAAPLQTRAAPAPDRGAVFERIALELTNAGAITAAMNAEVRWRPALAVGYAAPAKGFERDIAAVWEEVLQVKPVGANDSFQDLGGKSIHLVRIHGLLRDRLGVDVDLTTLFQYGTVSLLSARLSGAGDKASPAVARAEKMRAARARLRSRSAIMAGARR